MVEVHDRHFAQDARDEDWLPAVGARNWVVLTKDRRIKSRTSELAALVRGGVAAFVLSSANMNGDQMAAAAYVSALPAMLRALARVRRPFVARVTRGGEVEILLSVPTRSRRPVRPAS